MTYPKIASRAPWGTLSDRCRRVGAIVHRSTLEITEAPGRQTNSLQPRQATSLEELGMGTRSNKNGLLVGAPTTQPVDQEKVTADVALAMVGPIPRQGMVKPFRTKWSIVGHEQHHRLLELLHVVAARVRKAGPVSSRSLISSLADAKRALLIARASTVRVDEHIKTQARETLAGMGLTVSDAIRVFLTRVVADP